MESIVKYILQIAETDKGIAWGYTSTQWTAVSAASTALGTIFIMGSIGVALWGMYQNRKINIENNEIQKDRILQERLIELSHEWNSKDFIQARNESVLLMTEFKNREREAYTILKDNKRLSEWIFISMIAHFFERLSYIQLSGQISRKNAILEFKEAIDYWHDFLFEVYMYDEKNEERMRNSLTALQNEYDKIDSKIA